MRQLVELVGPVARALLGGKEPTEILAEDLRPLGGLRAEGDQSLVLRVTARLPDREIAFVWKRAQEGKASQRLRRETEVYHQLEGRSRRICELLASMMDSEGGCAIILEYLPTVGDEALGEGWSPTVLHSLTNALAAFAEDIGPGPGALPYVAQALRELRTRAPRSGLWHFAAAYAEEEGATLARLPRVASPGFRRKDVGKRDGEPELVFLDLHRFAYRPWGADLARALALDPEAPERFELLTGRWSLDRRDLHLLALLVALEAWVDGNPDGRAAICRHLEWLGVGIPEAVRLD